MPSTRTENLGPMAKFLSPKGRATAAAYVQRDVQFARVLEARERKRVAEAAEVAALEKRRRLECAVTDEIMAAEREADAAEARMKAVTKAATISAPEEVADALEGDDTWMKLRPLVESLIQERPSVSWSALHGQPDAMARAKPIVNAINRNYDQRPPGGLLLTGPPGVGKTTLAQIMASEMECTFFHVPKTFGRGKPEHWSALFAIAAEYAPCIVLIDESDGVMSKKHTCAVTAITDLWNPVGRGASKHPFVLILGATNKPEVLNDAISDRFGPPVEFKALDEVARRAIFHDNLSARVEMSEADWGSLLARMDGWNGRQIATLCANVSLRVEDECAEAGVDVRPICLSDFQAQVKQRVAEETLDPGVVDMAVRFLKIEFEWNEGAVVLNLRDLINHMSAQALVILGLPNWRQICASNNTTIPEVFIRNLKICLAAAFPQTWGDAVTRMKDPLRDPPADERMVKLCRNPTGAILNGITIA